MTNREFQKHEKDINKELEERYKKLEERGFWKSKENNIKSDNSSLNKKDNYANIEPFYVADTYDTKLNRELNNILRKKREEEEKDNWIDKLGLNVGNPDTDNGHWITLENGKHLFIKDKV